MSTNKFPTRSQSKRNGIMIFLFSLIITIILGGIFIISFFRGFVDFPCFVAIDNGILDLGGFEDYDESSHAILFITTFFAHTSGGGCKIVELADGESTNIGDYQVRVKGYVIYINGDQQLDVGDEFEDTNKRMTLNPWYWYEDTFSITNYGYVIGIQSRYGEVQNLEKDLLIATGIMGSREHLNPVTTIIFILSLFGTIIKGFALFFQWINRNQNLRKDRDY